MNECVYIYPIISQVAENVPQLATLKDPFDIDI